MVMSDCQQTVMENGQAVTVAEMMQFAVRSDGDEVRAVDGELVGRRVRPRDLTQRPVAIRHDSSQDKPKRRQAAALHSARIPQSGKWPYSTDAVCGTFRR